MARTAITKTTAPGGHPTAGVALTWVSADAVNSNKFTMGGNDLLLVRNGHASAAKTVTINSAPDAQGRSRDITAESIAAGVTKCFGPFRERLGWVQSGGVLHCAGEDNNIKFAVIAL